MPANYIQTAWAESADANQANRVEEGWGKLDETSQDPAVFQKMYEFHSRAGAVLDQKF